MALEWKYGFLFSCLNIGRTEFDYVVKYGFLSSMFSTKILFYNFTPRVGFYYAMNMVDVDVNMNSIYSII